MKQSRENEQERWRPSWQRYERRPWEKLGISQSEYNRWLFCRLLYETGKLLS